MTTLQVVLCCPEAKVPTRGSVFAAGLDLYSIEEKNIPTLSRVLFDTGIKVHLPEGTYGRIAPRSGLALNYSIDVCAGVIDRDYTGRIQVLLVNNSPCDIKIEKGQKIAQLICEKIVIPNVSIVTDIPHSERGCKGFGSSGK